MERNKFIKPNKVISSTPVLFEEKSQKCIFSFVPFTKTLIVLFLLQQILLNNDSLFWLHLHVLLQYRYFVLVKQAYNVTPTYHYIFLKELTLKKELLQ